MPQTAPMGPPLSPRETRRSGRRSAPSVSASASKSPDSDQPPTRERPNSSRTGLPSSNHRGKRLKQEDYDEGADDKKQTSASSASSAHNNHGNGKSKRRSKDKEKQGATEGAEVVVEDNPRDPPEDDEEQGITRCVCGSSEDDPDAGEFMVQCETCKVWQHGLCMGYQSEEQVHDDDYYCEICRPELHVELLKRLGRRPRQTSAASRLDNSRVSRSRSPTQLLKAPTSKRRNTMNSRDAAFDESLKEIIEATAAEAAAAESANLADAPATQTEAADKTKKRKRSDEDTNAKKRTRSASITSDLQSVLVEVPPTEKLPVPVTKPAVRNKRGGRKPNVVELTTNETEEGKKQVNNSRAKAASNAKRPQIGHSTISASNGPEHGQRRNPTGGSGPTTAAEARAYRQTHAYAVSQQTMYTSWNLPDYLSHLEQLLPSDIPQPLEVRSGGSGSRGESAERTMERGVKVKWPAKRMSVADMNKRVRALVEWVGREQANALDRGRRREALEKALREQAGDEKFTGEVGDVRMLVDNESIEQQLRASAAEFVSQSTSESALQMSARTMKMMEELMEELIGFQEKFGPGAKLRERRYPGEFHCLSTATADGCLQTHPMTMVNESNRWEGHTSIPDARGNSTSTLFGDEEDDDAEFAYPGAVGHYSSQMEDLFDGEDTVLDKVDDDDQEEAFFYDGIDAVTSIRYMEQLRDVLGQDHEEENEEEEVERSLVIENGHVSHEDDEPLKLSMEKLVEGSPDISFSRALSPESGVSSPDPNLYPFNFSNPVLHPTVSRLRSFTQQSSRSASNVDSLVLHSRLFGGESPVPSQLSSLSRESSASDLHSKPSATKGPDELLYQQDVFKWTELQAISQTLYSKASQKASALLGARLLGAPTVLAANGLICIGTTEGKVAVYDFKQILICVCESNIPVDTIGPVTAVALSYDHTFIAVGYATGYIQLYNLKHPHSPVRSVPPTALAVVATGRKEGHLQGSKIISIGFIAGRHTAIVSADDHGLAFFHSLGKVLFVEAPDILRILGRYPSISARSPSTLPAKQNVPPIKATRYAYAILAMAPLPLGTITHPTDSYQIISLLTPTKLVVVGLRPTPRTWFKCPRELHDGKLPSKWIGALSWFPSLATSAVNGDGSVNGNDAPTPPMLAFSWGNLLHILRIFESRMKQNVLLPKSGKSTELQTGTVSYDMFGKWATIDDILAVQWLNHNQIMVICRDELVVYDLALSRSVEQVKFDAISPTIPDGEGRKSSELGRFDHTFRIYKGKLFLLRRNKLVVGTLLTWVDRILALVEQGDFLKAIELSRLYYIDEAPGNRNNLPVDPQRRKQAIGEKLRRIMVASAQYAFSEERMSDGTHITPDGRGVDRTSLFEGIVKVCCEASLSLGDFDFLFEDLFQKYDDSGILSIYLRQLEPFVLDNSIRHVPPRIAQRLVALHEQDHRPDLAERIIWHIQPSCLDINQTIKMCQRYQLYDALIYVNTRAIRDYVAPVVELLGLIRKVQQYRKSREEYSHRSGQFHDTDPIMESTVMNAYKVFPYLANVLSGLTYPSEEPIDSDEAFRAKEEVYKFLFFGRSSVWPPEVGKLVLTADEEGGLEPTYPYARLLLVFDAESFLHSLDIALEDGFLHDERQSTINRLMVVTIILEIMSTGKLPQTDITMINIFIARNVPKYHQSLQLPPSTLHNILIGLAEDPDSSTREDRQLATEYLLSVYNPHDSERIFHLFEQAEFYRILRTWHHRNRCWPKLLSTYIDDPDIPSMDLLIQVEEVLSSAAKVNGGSIPDDLVPVISRSLAKFHRVNISATAHLLGYWMPSLHSNALDSFGAGVDADKCRYQYLQALLGLKPNDDDFGPINKSSDNISPDLRQVFFTLQCRFDPDNVISTLRHFPKGILDLDRIQETCESQRVYDAAVWLTNWRGHPQNALSKADSFQISIIHNVVDTCSTSHPERFEISEALSSLKALARISCNICMENSQRQGATEESAEEMWFQLLNNQIRAVQLVAANLPSWTPSEVDDSSTHQMVNLLSALRSLVQTSFSALVSITSTSTVSFPRLFKRLVNSTSSVTGSHYTEFRMILTSMLESYRSDEDLLIILKHLLDRDVFEMVLQATKEREYGWTASQGTCQYCHNPLLSDTQLHHSQVIVSRTGPPSHLHCQTILRLSK